MANLVSNLNFYSSPGVGDGYLVIWPENCRLLGFIAENFTNATRWIQIFDLASLPNNNDVPIISLKLLAGQQSSFDAENFGFIPISNGLTFASSTSTALYTASNSLDLWVNFFWTRVN